MTKSIKLRKPEEAKEDMYYVLFKLLENGFIAGQYFNGSKVFYGEGEAYMSNEVDWWVNLNDLL